jgi:hypothetical protein
MRHHLRLLIPDLRLLIRMAEAFGT